MVRIRPAIEPREQRQLSLMGRLGIGLLLLATILCTSASRGWAAPQDVDAEPAPAPVAARSAEIPPGVSEASTHFWLNWPFSPDDGHVLEHTYLYGSARSGSSKLHSGADIRATLGTPVVAGVAGQVVFAGDDSSRVFGPRPRYYGKLVLLQLDRADCPEDTAGEDPAGCNTLPVYALYGHLNQVYVKTGQLVKTGDVIGRVGMTGVAMGPHLHLEIRVGSATFEATRNPGLWLQSRTGRGVIAGRLLDPGGNYLANDRILVYRVAGGNKLWTVVTSYPADPLVKADDTWQENFVLPDTAGRSVRAGGRARRQARAHPCDR